jgi:uncharacterized membrane protein
LDQALAGNGRQEGADHGRNYQMSMLARDTGVILFGGRETHTRSVLKALSWRALGTLDTFAISWLMTGRMQIAGSIAGLEILTKVAWYYFHERIWAAIAWGRR